LITHGKFTFEDTDFGVRLMKIRNKAISLIHEYVPNEVVIEDI
jgi:Holliday junction resolvasome RuvABC endonuclease subunit